MSIRLFSLFAAAAVLGGAAPAPAQNGLVGEWRNTNNNVHMRVSPCGAALCGTVTWAEERQRADARRGSGKDLVGSVLLHDLRPAGNATWRGKAFIPDVNVNATATVVQVSHILIRVSGCSWFGLACKTQHWHRI